jgi:hypothetical protein
MTKKDVGRMFRHGKAKTLFLSIPSRVVTDKRFPFKEGEYVMVIIQGRKLVVEKIEG